MVVRECCLLVVTNMIYQEIPLSISYLWYEVLYQQDTLFTDLQNDHIGIIICSPSFTVLTRIQNKEYQTTMQLTLCPTHSVVGPAWARRSIAEHVFTLSPLFSPVYQRQLVVRLLWPVHPFAFWTLFDSLFLSIIGEK